MVGAWDCGSPKDIVPSQGQDARMFLNERKQEEGHRKERRVIHVNNTGANHAPDPKTSKKKKETNISPKNWELSNIFRNSTLP
ncbi:hypothetical protein BDV12DRAFT_77637 [Aspergillus spectabilis]